MGLTPPVGILYRKHETPFPLKSLDHRNSCIPEFKIANHNLQRGTLPVLQRGKTIQFHVPVTPFLREGISSVTVLTTSS